MDAGSLIFYSPQQMINNKLAEPRKTVSLPKLKIHTQIDSPALRPLKQLHKVKWSIAPKCLLAGHQGQQILYICIHPKCQEPTRLVCETCFFKSHAKHNEQFLAVDEVKKGSIDKLRYWPFQMKYRKIFEFLTQHESYINNMVQDINATFSGMAMRILNTIDKIRLKLLKKIDSFYIKQTTKKKFTQKLGADLQNCFDLKSIGQIVRQLFSKEIRHEIFLQKMNGVLNDQQKIQQREALLEYFNQSEKGADLSFDKMHFLKKQNWIIQQIQEQQKALKHQTVTIDEAEMGIEKIVVQTIDYLNKNAEGLKPLIYGEQELEDGSTYQGFLYKNQRALFGLRKYKNGSVYYGEWKHNAKNGWGVYENKSEGYRYAGEWKEDRKWGYGKESTLTWIYEGNYVADRRDGFGVLMEDGKRWQINWKGDKKHGQGKLIQKNGQQTQIYFLNGVESQSKINKASPAFDIRQLSKKFTSVKSTSN